MPAMMTPAPAWTPEEEAEGKEYEEERKQRAETSEAISEWAVEGHSIPIVWIRQGRSLTGWRLDGDWRSLRNASLIREEGDACKRGDQHQSRDDT
jgi:hypothetical protein